MISTLVGFVSHPQTQDQQGLDIITIMLLVGLGFLAVIGLGELVRRNGHRRQERKNRARAF